VRHNYIIVVRIFLNEFDTVPKSQLKCQITMRDHPEQEVVSLLVSTWVCTYISGIL
jgi:hypothetical protein